MQLAIVKTRSRRLAAALATALVVATLGASLTV